jgi:hypothetical protein
MRETKPQLACTVPLQPGTGKRQLLKAPGLVKFSERNPRRRLGVINRSYGVSDVI